MQYKPTRHFVVYFILFVILLSAGIHADVVKWDYVYQPVVVTEDKPSTLLFVARGAAVAFDGYGAQGDKPAAIRAWLKEDLPTPASPFLVDVDYGNPVAVSCFLHYFYVPGSRDLRYTVPVPSAYKAVRIFSKNDGEEWSEVITLDDLPNSCPQKLITGSSRSARYWRIEVLELAAGAEMLCSYELETYIGGVPELRPWTECGPDFPAQFYRRISNHKPAAKQVCDKISIQESDQGFDVAIPDNSRIITGSFSMRIDGERCAFQKDKKGLWRTSTPSGDIVLEAKNTTLGLLLNLTYHANAKDSMAYRRASIELSAPDVDLYYIPAYVWSTKKPEDRMVNSCNVQTRMAGLGTKDAMLLLVPGTDRGSLGFVNGVVKNDLLLSREPTPVLLTAVHGDWWSAYQFAVKDIYDFSEIPQTVPVSEIQYGISRYIMRDDIWEPTLGTLKAWPPYDPCAEWTGGFDSFSFYGTPYSIPAYWARYVMNGDAQALERCKSIAHWLCHSGVRVQEGPAKGVFFSMQRFHKIPAVMDRQGCSQAGGPWLTSQATGAALWALAYYRKATGDRNADVDQAIQEGAAWLLKTQREDGGWPFEHFHDGVVNDDDPPSSGSIWNIWALWRLGKETQNQDYLDAAEKGKNWFANTFVKPHHYHGYWEDVGWASREGYEAGIAAVAFGEMGEKELVVETAKDAMQWVFTRQIECREKSCSAGLVAEQTGWPPAAYCNPMMGLAAWTAWQTTKDDFWKPFARIPQAIGWWYQPESGAMVWIVDSTEMAPIAGPSFESWWTDWINAQIGSLTLRWLVREVNLRSGGEIQIDEELLCGRANQRDVKLWAPPGGLHPILPPDGQVNWLGFRGEDSILIAFMNNGNKGEISCPLDSRDVQGASLCPKAVHYFKRDKYSKKPWNGEFPLRVKNNQMIICEWRIKM